MATALQRTAEQRFLMHDVSWQAYERLLADQENHGVRMTYDRGMLELMSPSSEHEWIKSFLGRLIEMLTFQLRIPIRTGGSMTLRREFLAQGLEPDESYYIRNEALVRGRRKIDRESDPPPDLAIEVDITSSSIDRMAIYAALGVCEVWRYDTRSLRFFERDETGEYREVQRSVNLPMISPPDIGKFIARLDETDEHSVLQEFCDWVRATLLK